MRTKREIEKDMKMSLGKATAIIFSKDFRKICAFVLKENNLKLIKEATDNGYINYSFKSMHNQIVAALVDFLKQCRQTPIDLSDIDIYSVNNIKIKILSELLQVSLGEALKIINFLNCKSNSLTKMINKELKNKVFEIRMQFLKMNAEKRVQKEDEEIYHDFLASRLNFEDYALENNITVGKLQRLVLDFEILGKTKPNRVQTSGFDLNGYLQSLDKRDETYILFLEEEKVFSCIQRYEEGEKCSSIVIWPNRLISINAITIKKILNYYEKFYPKAYHALLERKTKKANDEERKKTLSELSSVYKEKGSCLNSFLDFYGDKYAFMKYYNLSEEEFDKLMQYLEIHNPDLYHQFMAEIDEFYENNGEDYISDIMDIQYLYNKLGAKMFSDTSKLYTFVYEYYQSASKPLEEAVKFATLVRKRNRNLFIEYYDLFKPALSVGIHFCSIGARNFNSRNLNILFDKGKFLNGEHSINNIIISEEIIDEIISVLEENEIPLFDFIVREAIRRYINGTLDEFIKEIPLNSDYMKMKLSKEEK